MGEVPAALDGLHPGQTGVVVLGRVIMGDIAVTLVNLIQREVLTVEESMDQGDWLLTVTPGTATKQKHGALLDYEKRLLDGLRADGGESHLSSLAGQFGKVLDETRKDLIRDAVHQGWLRHLHHDQGTAKGKELAGHVRSFRRDLRRLVSEGDQRALSGQLMPYALRFGLLSDQQAPLVRFAQAWVRAFADLPGWAPPQPTRPEYDSDQQLFADVGHIPGADMGGLIAMGWLPGCPGNVAVQLLAAPSTTASSGPLAWARAWLPETSRSGTSLSQEDRTTAATRMTAVIAKTTSPAEENPTKNGWASGLASPLRNAVSLSPPLRCWCSAATWPGLALAAAT